MESLTRHLAVMGTSFVLTVAAPSREAALRASEAGVREVERVEALLSTWREGTPLARLNAAAPGVGTPVPAELFALLKRVFEWQRETDGSFDPTVLPLVRVWGLRSGGRIPSDAELLAARRSTGANLFTFEESSLLVARNADSAGIDEGAWGKGWALDKAAAAMRAAGATSGVIDLGGQVLVFGEEAGIDAADPRQRSLPVGRLLLRDASASTSGNSERGVTVNGRRIGHLLDPRTGEPAPDFGSVTVVAPSGLTADVLSTAFFVFGAEKGLELSERLRTTGVANEALFFSEGEESRDLRVSMSPGMKRLFSPSRSKKSSEGVPP